MVLLIDNYDSFTYNLVQRLGEIDASIELKVVRNDQISPDQAEALRPSHIIISPGPCTPKESGVSPAIIERFAGRVPILGVCLGHQCIGDMHGMTVTRHAVPMHGKTSPIRHDNKGLFKGLSNPFTATRYHSLVVLEDTIPHEGWTVSAWTDEPHEGGTRRVVMGLRRDWPKAPLEGVQFHPESFLTTEGPTLLRNFLDFQPILWPMIHPAPTTPIAPTIARGVLAATSPHVVIEFPNTSYQMHLVPTTPITSPVGKRIVGTIAAQARRVDVVDTGGSYVEPVTGRPRRVQGRVVATDAKRNIIVVNAGMPIHLVLTDDRQRTQQFELGALVSTDVLDGATFSPQ